MKAAYLGIDVGSISTNLVLVDDSGGVLHKKWSHGIGSENER
jgi:activator of 2-hydroxyglutaryl-CoA dehydratase